MSALGPCYGCGEPLSNGKHRASCPIFVSAAFPSAPCPCGKHVLLWPQRAWFLRADDPRARLTRVEPLPQPPPCVRSGPMLTSNRAMGSNRPRAPKPAAAP